MLSRTWSPGHLRLLKKSHPSRGWKKTLRRKLVGAPSSPRAVSRREGGYRMEHDEERLNGRAVNSKQTTFTGRRTPATPRATYAVIPQQRCSGTEEEAVGRPSLNSFERQNNQENDNKKSNSRSLFMLYDTTYINDRVCIERERG